MKTGEKLRLVVACVAASLLTAIGSQQLLGKDAHAQSNILRTSRLEIVDASGKIRGVFEVSKGNAVIMLTDPSGNQRISFLSGPTGEPALALFDKNGINALTMVVDPSSSKAAILFVDRDGKLRGAIAKEDDGSFEIRNYDQNQKVVSKWP
jgi:hypothetical protein